MKTRTYVTVVPRVLTKEPQKGSVILLFPEWDGGQGLCMSYMKVGQHGSADYAGMMGQSRPATESEYMPLLEEWRNMGGEPANVIVRKRRLRARG